MNTIHKENFMGLNGIDWCYSILKCSRDWVCLVKKDSTNLIGDNSLDGLVIDWHLANAEMCESTANDFVEPISNYEPTYAYA